MPIEKDLQDNTAAMNKVTEALEKYGPAIAKLGGGEAAAAKPAGKGKAEAKAPPPAAESSHTVDDIHQMAVRVAKEKGKPAAQQLIKSGGASDLADLKNTPALFDAFMEACESALSGDDGLGL